MLNCLQNFNREKVGIPSAVKNDKEVQEQCKVILVINTEIATKVYMIIEGRSVLENAFIYKELTINSDDDNEIIISGNQSEDTMTCNLNKMEQDDKISNNKIISLQEQLNSLKTGRKFDKSNIHFLDNTVATLIKSLEAYQHIQNRFISTFKRDKLKNATFNHFAIITSANS